MRWSAPFIALCVLLIVAGAYASTSGKDATYYVRINLNGRYVTADSSDTVKFCPSGEDTTSNCTYCAFIGSDALRIWSFAPDSSEVYDAYANDTLITYMQDRFYLSTNAPDGFIQSTNVFGDGVVPGDALAANAAWENLAATGAAHKADATGTALSSSATAFEADTLVAAVLISRDNAALNIDGDSTSVVDIQEGFLDPRPYTYNFPADSTTQVYALPGAVSSMIFDAWSDDLRLWSAKYESAGHVRVTTTSSVSADSVHVIGYAR